MTDQGKTYAAFVEGELKAERERRASYEARSQALVTTSGALVTLLGGLAALVKTAAVTRFPLSVLIAAGVALGFFIGAAACGIVAGWNRHYAVAKATTLTAMLDEHWTDTEIDARNNVATLHAITVNTLRKANDFKARWVSIGLVLQVFALSALGTAVAIVIGKS